MCYNSPESDTVLDMKLLWYNILMYLEASGLDWYMLQMALIPVCILAHISQSWYFH